MKFTTFDTIRKSVFIGMPIVVIVMLFRTCSSCTSTQNDRITPASTQEQIVENNNSSLISPLDYSQTTLPRRAIEEEILSLAESPLTTGKPDGKGGMKRTIKKEMIKIDMRCDQQKGFTSWNRIKVDWNSNGKYDEKWNLRENGTVARFVAPLDDENYTKEYRLGATAWTVFVKK